MVFQLRSVRSIVIAPASTGRESRSRGKSQMAMGTRISYARWAQSEGFVPAGTEVANAGSSETTRQTFTIPSTLIDQTLMGLGHNF